MVSVYYSSSFPYECGSYDYDVKSFPTNIVISNTLLPSYLGGSDRHVQFKCLGMDNIGVYITASNNAGRVDFSSNFSTGLCYSAAELQTAFGTTSSNAIRHSAVFSCQDTQDTCIPMKILSGDISPLASSQSLRAITNGLGSRPFQCPAAEYTSFSAFDLQRIQMDYDLQDTQYDTKPNITSIVVQSCTISPTSCTISTCTSSIQVNTPYSISVSSATSIVAELTFPVNNTFSILPISPPLPIHSIDSIQVIPWTYPGGGANNTDLVSDIVHVEELTVCMVEYSEVYAEPVYSPCGAVCGEVSYSIRPSYCKGGQDNMYPPSACGAPIYPPMVCLVSSTVLSSYEGNCVGTWVGVQGPVVAVAGPEYISITWSEVDPQLTKEWLITVTPAGDAGLRNGVCRGYQYQGITCRRYTTRPTQPFKISGLSNDNQYIVTVELRDEKSVLSLPGLSNTVTPKALDTIDPNVIPADSEVSVNWNSPTYHGSPIVGYTVRVIGNNIVTEWEAVGSPKIITGLTNGKLYVFQVLYNNTNGDRSNAGRSQDAIPRGIVAWTKPQGTCTGKCGYGSIAKYGQTTPICEDMLQIVYPDSVCSSLNKDSTCKRICPPAPLNVRVTAQHNGALTISWDPSQSPLPDAPIEWYYVVVNFGKPNSRYQKTNLTTATVQGLENGVRHEIQVRSVTNTSVQSELSTSAWGTPNKGAACYGGCNNNGGICKLGICWCWPGWYGQQCENSWIIQIDYPTSSVTKDMRKDVGGDDVDAGNGYIYKISYTMYKNSTYTDKFQNADSVPRPDVLLFNKAECAFRGDKFCVPHSIKFSSPDFHVSPSMAYTGNTQWSMSRSKPSYYSLDNPTAYYTTVWISPNLNATTTNNLILEYNAIWCLGKMQGSTCINQGITKDPASCDEFSQQCVCDSYSSDGNSYVTGLDGQCNEINSCGKNLVTGDQTNNDCGMFGECQTNGVCKCLEGFTTVGDAHYCNKGPDCKLRCLNGGYPEFGPGSTPPNDCTDTKCICPGNYEGEFCQKCGLVCANGGRVDTFCSSCTCPMWYKKPTGEGDQCKVEYQYVTFVLNIKPDDYLLPGSSLTFSSNPPFIQRLKETISVIFPKYGISNIDVGDALAFGNRIKIRCSMPRRETSAGELASFRSLLENVKSEWYQHYMTSFTDPESLLVTQREQGTSELTNYGSVTQVISYSVLFASFLLIFLQS